MKKLLKKWFSQDYIVNTVAVICIVSVFIFSMFYIILKFNLYEPSCEYRLYDSTLEVTDIVVLKSKESGVLYFLDEGTTITPIYDENGNFIVR